MRAKRLLRLRNCLLMLFFSLYLTVLLSVPLAIRAAPAGYALPMLLGGMAVLASAATAFCAIVDVINNALPESYRLDYEDKERRLADRCEDNCSECSRPVRR